MSSLERFSGQDLGFENVVSRLNDGEEIPEEEIEPHLEQLRESPQGKVLVEKRFGNQEEDTKTYSFAFSTDYMDKPDLSSQEDKLNFLAGEALGVNEDYRKARAEEKGEAHVLMVGEPNTGTKLSSPKAWRGLAYKLSEIREEEGDDYFSDEKFRMYVGGSVIPRVPLFYSITNDEDLELLDSVDETEDYDERVENIEEALEDSTLEEVIGDRVVSEDRVDDVMAMIDDSIDEDELARKIVDYEMAIESIEEEFGKVSDAIGRDVPVVLADGEEGRENRKEIKEADIQNYVNKVRDIGEEIDENIDEMMDAVRQVNETLEEYEDVSGDLRDRLTGIDEEDLIDGELVDTLEETDVPEEAEDHVDEMRERRREIQDAIDDLETTISMKKTEVGALNAEKAVREALGPGGAKILSRTNIKADWNEILNEATDAQYRKLHEDIDNVDFREIVYDGDIATFELNGNVVQAAHNLNGNSDVPLKYGHERMINQREQMSDVDPDLFINSHHGQGRVRFVRKGRGMDSDIMAAVQVGTFQDGREVVEAKKEGMDSNWDVKRHQKGMYDSTVMLAELDHEEVDGKVVKTPRFRAWAEEDLRNIGRQLEVEEFLEEVEDRKLEQFLDDHSLEDEFEPDEFREDFRETFGREDEDLMSAFFETQVLGFDYKEDEMQGVSLIGDSQLGAPHGLRWAHQTPIEDMLELEIDYIEDETPDDQILVDIGDAVQGWDAFRGQGTENYIERGDMFNESWIRPVRERVEEAGGGPEEKLAADEVVSKRVTLQQPSQHLHQQLNRVRELIDDRVEQMIEEDSLGRAYIGTGNHENNNLRGDNNIDGAGLRENGFARAKIEDGEVEIMEGTTDGSREHLEIGDNEVLVSHKSSGRGKDKNDKMLNSNRPPSVDVEYSGHDHQAALAFQNRATLDEEESREATGDDFLTVTATPADQPMNDLTDFILDGDTIQGIVADQRLDVRDYKHSTVTEFLLRP